MKGGKQMNDSDFKKAEAILIETGYLQPRFSMNISIPDAKEALSCGLKNTIGENAQWLKEYDNIVSWLSDNNGRGLLCYGNCGRGKTVICNRIIPVLFHFFYKKFIHCCNAVQLNYDINSINTKYIISIDDVGTESLSVKYGERRMPFAELVDEAEKRGSLLIISTNLSIAELTEKYGVRTVDRLKAITKTVLFKGESLRR